MSVSFERLGQLDDRTQYIVFGFIRNADQNIPKLIQCICLLYVDDYFMMDSGRYCWHIKDKQEIHKMFKAKIGDKFESSAFEIGKLKWILHAYPSGYNSIHSGSFKLYLKLLSSIPNEWKHIVICVRTQCTEIELLYTSIKLIKQDSRIPLWSNATLLLKDVIHLDLDSLTFEIKMKILRIYVDTNKIFYQFSLHKYYRKSQYLQWKLDKSLINSVKSGCRMGSSYESKIYNQQWCITCCPNSNKGNVILCLQLVCLPCNVAKLNVQYTLRCHEANIESTTVKVFEYEQGRSYGLWAASKMLSFEQFKSYDSITLSADIMVLDEIQCNSCASTQDEIEQYWLQYSKSLQYFHEISNSYYDHKYYQLEKRLNTISTQITDMSHQMSQFTTTMYTLLNQNKNNKIWSWLKDCVGLECYYDRFIDNGLDSLDIVSTLNENHLIAIGIHKLGHRIKLIKCIANLDDCLVVTTNRP
eukprot:125597_1